LGGSQSAPVSLQADNVGGSKPAIFAVPRLGSVFWPILFGDRPRPKEGFVPLSFVVHAFLIYTSVRKTERKSSKKDKKDLKNIDAYRVYRAGTGWCTNTVHVNISGYPPHCHDRIFVRALLNRDQPGPSQLFQGTPLAVAADA
jgi:hypothetical protein